MGYRNKIDLTSLLSSVKPRAAADSGDNSLWVHHYERPLHKNMDYSCFKDTVFVSSSVPRWSGHVEQNQVSSLRLVDHHLVQLDSCVHPTNI